MNKTTIPIKGMHCRSCEILIEDELKGISGVTNVTVNHRKGCADLTFQGNSLNLSDVNQAVVNAGYQVGMNEGKPLLSRNFEDYIDIIVSVIALFLLYIFINIFGLNKIIATGASHPSSLIAVALIGLTAGVSTCMALVGGLVLGVSSRFAQSHVVMSPLDRFKPHLVFNLGRIASYTVLGGIIGLAGAIFQVNGFSLGLLTIGAALVMLMLGLQLTGLFPRFTGFSFTLPKGISRLLGIKDQSNNHYSHKSAFLMGAATFFLPCGFTQAMQLFAISTGSFVSGAVIMGTFALGTAPGLLGVGGLASILKGEFAAKFFKFAGVVVVGLALFNLQNGLNLIGANPAYLLGTNTNALATTGDKNVSLENGVQVVSMVQASDGYSPNAFTISRGIPVKWVINSKDPNTCAASIMVNKFGILRSLHPGENTIEFTPTELGRIPFSCSMGMFTGSFTVVENAKAVNNQGSLVAGVAAAAQPTQPPKAPGCGGGGCGCGAARAKAQEQIAVTTPVPAIKVDSDVQLLKTTYTQNTDITPNQFVVSAGKPVRFEVDVKENGSGCMATIMIPQLAQDPKFLAQGETISFEFTPQQPGEYPITCAMGVPRGVIKVV